MIYGAFRALGLIDGLREQLVFGPKLYTCPNLLKDCPSQRFGVHLKRIAPPYTLIDIKDDLVDVCPRNLTQLRRW